MAFSPFTGTLSLGSSGPQVQELQQFLNANGFPVAQAGQPGSPGMETTTFGPATQKALQAFQAAHGIVSSGDATSTGYGNFGPQTLAAINNMITSGTATQGGIPGSTGAATDGATGTTGSNDTVNPQYRVDDATGVAQFANSQGAFITFSGGGYTPNQLYFIDPTNKQIIPFSSMQSAINYISNANPGSTVTADDINAHTTQIPSSAVSTGGALEGFTVEDSSHGFGENGTITNPAVSTASLSQNYGQASNTDNETKAYTALDGFTKLLSSGAAGTGTVTSAEIATIMNDPKTVGYYINALAYGGYTLADVYQDMIRQQYIANGNATAVQNAIPISASQTASVYKASANYQNVAKNPAMDISNTIAALGSAPGGAGTYNNILNTPVLQLPDAAFNAIAPLSDPNSPEFQSQMAQYASATYQIALEMASAESTADHAKAQADWQSLQTEISDRLGITLSDNAIQAWNQLGNFAQQASVNNLSGSGMVQQQIDDYLKQQSSVNQQMRKYYNTYEDQAKESYYQNYASPDEVKALIAADPSRAQAWGLTLTDAAKSYLTLSNLQALFPGTPASQLQNIINEYVDPNGNNYSKLYGSYAAQTYNTTEQQRAQEATDVMQHSQDTSSKALAQYSDPNTFDKPSGTGLPTPTLPSTGKETTPSSTSASSALNFNPSTAQSAAAKISSTIANGPTGNGITQSTPGSAGNTLASGVQSGQNAGGTKTTANPYGLTGSALDTWNAAQKLIPTNTATSYNQTVAPPANTATSYNQSTAPANKTTVPANSTTSSGPIGVLAPTNPVTTPSSAVNKPWSLSGFANTITNLFK